MRVYVCDDCHMKVVVTLAAMDRAAKPRCSCGSSRLARIQRLNRAALERLRRKIEHLHRCGFDCDEILSTLPPSLPLPLLRSEVLAIVELSALLDRSKTALQQAETQAE